MSTGLNIYVDEESWLHRGAGISIHGNQFHTAGASGVGATDVDCVTQEESQKMKKREYNRDYQREYRKRKKDSTINTGDPCDRKSCNDINTFEITKYFIT